MPLTTGQNRCKRKRGFLFLRKKWKDFLRSENVLTYSGFRSNVPPMLWWRGHLGRVADHAGKMPAPPLGLIQSRTDRSEMP